MKLFSFGKRVLNADLIAAFSVKSIGDNQFELKAEMQNGNSFSTDFDTVDELEKAVVNIAESICADTDKRKTHVHVDLMRMLTLSIDDYYVDPMKWKSFFPDVI